MTTRTGSDIWQAAHDQAVWGALGKPGVVSLSGPDARRFANGMFTNNVRDLAVGGVHRTAMVDDRGRVVGLLALAADADDRFLAVLEGVDPQAFIERYARYVVFDDVKLDDQTGRLVVATIQGPRAGRVLSTLGLPEPSAGMLTGDPGVRAWLRSRSRAGGVDLWVDAERWDQVRGALDAELPQASSDVLEALRVEAGHVAWPADLAFRQLPHELGLRDALLHFEKGCYIGQESINRIDVMGKVKWALAVLRTDEPLADGAEVVHEGRTCGRITSPVAIPGGGAAALAVLRKPADVPGTRLEIRGEPSRIAEVAGA